jgi:chromosome segregation protein
MVSQGRVGALVSARPEDRRAVLEEAAGITGLHARRHEAELKLRAAEANMARAEDLRGQLEAQLAGLKRQARQASRYRNISGAIRSAEADLLAIQRARVETARAAAQAALHDAGQAVAAATEAAVAAGAAATVAAAVVPALRDSEATARTSLERHRVVQEQLAAEEGRARAALADAVRRLDQLRRDLGHAEQLRRDAAAAEQRLDAEAATLAEADAGYATQGETAGSEATEAAEAVRLAEANANRATEAAAEANARVQAASQMLLQAEQRSRRVSEQFGRLQEERTRIGAQQVDSAQLDEAGREQATAESALTEFRDALEQIEQMRAATATALAVAREEASVVDTARTKLAAEAQALAEVLAVKDGERWPPMVDALVVPEGLETALGAALGEELTSALDPDAARHWRELPPFDPPPALPDGAVTLATLVQGPAALARALSQIGLAETEEFGEEEQSALAPGQVLVSRQGAVWRWDGYTIRAGTPTQAAVRLRQRNRLTTLRERLAFAVRSVEVARGRREGAEKAAQDAAAAEQRCRVARRDAEQRVQRAVAASAQLHNQAEAAKARLAAVEQQIAHLSADRDEAEAALARAREAHAALPDLAALRAAVDRARAALSAARSKEQAARTAVETLAREHATRTQRRERIAAECADWQQRARDAASRVTDLDARCTEATAEHAALKAAPAQIAARRASALEMLDAAETAHRHAAEALTAAASHAAEADRASRAAEAALGAARENVVRTEGAAAQADQAWGTVAERILERLGVDPALPDPPADLSSESEEKARRRLERLLKEREEMGPVNLRADVEAEEVEKRLASLATEREELATAIAKLRGSIGHLNREGRERLNAVFQQVDQHFQALFTRMFGGGRAHLALVGSDDPLEAGLEIYAQPPGKKLATLSLLSGGEQALTALSLIFAVFRCNPAPVCVLDEVDAPLDDANVERFCTLLEDVVRETGTRFLVVTHHPLTMARMDRLYGVTMQERGVSRLLSVDLQRAAAMAEQPRMAAE